MLLGVLALVGVTIAGSTVADALVAKEEQKSGKAVSISAAVRATAPALSLLADDLSRLTNPQGAAGVIATGTVNVRTGEDLRLDRPGDYAAISWVRGERSQLYRMPLLEGRLALGEAVLPATVVLNQAAANQFSVGPDEILRLKPASASDGAGAGTAVVGGADFVVGGIVADGFDEAHAYSTLSTLNGLFPNDLQKTAVEVRVVVPDGLAAKATQAIKDTAERRGIALESAPTRADTVREVREQLELVQNVFQGVAVVLLLVAALGIANVGVSSVRERAYELSVRRALGARPLDVFGQTIGAALLVGLCVAVVSIISALLGAFYLVPSLIPETSGVLVPEFPWQACASGVVASVGVSLLGGILPGVLATRVPVAAALRS